MNENSTTVIVAVRVRPFNRRELTEKECSIVQMPSPGVVNLLPKHINSTTRQFSFDHTFWSIDNFDHELNTHSSNARKGSHFADQSTVFKSIALPLLYRALDGYNACLFAYGMTSSGKTYSITGPPDNPGITSRLVDNLFDMITERQSPETAYSIELSYLEIYNEKIRDLLSSAKPDPGGLAVREHPVTGPYVEGLSRTGVRTSTDVLGWLRTGSRQRTVASTEMNEHSSRSHTVLTLYITRRTLAKYPFGDMVESIYTSQISIVDLAGSERQSSLKGLSSDRFTESCQINRSLFTLGRVISQLSATSSLPTPNSIKAGCPASEPRPRRPAPMAPPQMTCTPNQHLSKRSGYVSYRDSVLTWLLKDSLGGNALTTILATVSPSSLHYEETLNTLRYVKKAQSIVNTAIVNEDPRGRVIRQLRNEVAELRKASCVAHEPGSPQAYEVSRLRELLSLRENEICELSRRLTSVPRLEAATSPHLFASTVDATNTSPMSFTGIRLNRSRDSSQDFVDNETDWNTPFKRHSTLVPLICHKITQTTDTRPAKRDMATEFIDPNCCTRQEHVDLNDQLVRLKSELSVALASLEIRRQIRLTDAWTEPIDPEDCANLSHSVLIDRVESLQTHLDASLLLSEKKSQSLTACQQELEMSRGMAALSVQTLIDRWERINSIRDFLNEADPNLLKTSSINSQTITSSEEKENQPPS